jgi:hypothetical protein
MVTSKFLKIFTFFSHANISENLSHADHPTQVSQEQVIKVIKLTFLRDRGFIYSRGSEFVTLTVPYPTVSGHTISAIWT